jgi:hypothetical protein
MGSAEILTHECLLMATQALDKPGYAGPELKSDKANKKNPANLRGFS